VVQKNQKGADQDTHPSYVFQKTSSENPAKLNEPNMKW